MKLLFALGVVLLGWSGATCASEPPHEWCPRPSPGSVVSEPEDLHSENGVLKVDLTVHNETEADGSARYCYLLGNGSQSPTLHLKPGELLILNLKNALTAASTAAPQHGHQHGIASSDPCTSAKMTLTPVSPRRP